MEHAAFFRRGAALLVDVLLLPILWFAMLMLVAVAGGFISGILDVSDETSDRVFDDVFGPAAVILMIAVPLLYSAVLEAGTGGTAGKHLLGIRVESADGGNLRFLRALVRAAAKIVSTAVLGAGFLPAAVTERHQAFHDLLAGSVVLRGRRQARAGDRVLGPPGQQADAPQMVRDG
jgi:uncharacterized RDD family membrane protein YckC